jgi:hypothetical protein
MSVMDANPSAPTATLALVESVRCLECTAVYAKPAGGGTVRANPGCPECGYVGWLALSIPFSRELAQHRFFAGRQRRRSA